MPLYTHFDPPRSGKGKEIARSTELGSSRWDEGLGM